NRIVALSMGLLSQGIEVLLLHRATLCAHVIFPILPARRALRHCRESACGASPATGAASAARLPLASWARRCRDAGSPRTTGGAPRRRTGGAPSRRVHPGTSRISAA